MAEWREAKPIIEELDRRNERRDIRMCVVTRSGKMYRRAVAWANSQSRSRNIMVLPGFSRQTVEEFISNHLTTVSYEPGPSSPDEFRVDEELPFWLVPQTRQGFPEPFHWVSL